MAIDIKDTYSLMQAMERIKKPATFLVDTFFPNVPTVSPTTKIAVEYRKRGRKLAPFIVNGTTGVNMARDAAKLDIYKPPMVGPRRVIDPDTLLERGFGENVYSTVSPAERASKMQADDLVDLQSAIFNRKNKMAADILTTGQCKIEGYADDGKQILVDTVTFDWEQKVTLAKNWDQAGASIYSDLKNASEMIQENAGAIPDVCIVGKNIEQYLLSNDELGRFLAIPSLQNLQLATFQPHYISPQVRWIGNILGLGLEVYSYTETYQDDSGKVQSFIGDDDVIIGISGRGHQKHGAVTLINDSVNGYDTFVSEMVPYYVGSKESQQLALTLYSRFLLTPETADDWAYIKAK